MRNFVLFLVFLTILSGAVYAATSVVVKTARKKTGSTYGSSSSSSYTSSLLNSSYERAVSPYDFDGEPVVVYVTIPSVVLFSLEENKQLVSYVATVNIVCGSFSFYTSALQTWTDSRLVFDPDETGSNYTILPSSMVWIPTVFCYNSIDVHRMDTEKDSNEVLISPSGTVTLFMRARFDTICDCDISQFPFDTQFCSIDFDTGLSASDRQILVPIFQENYFKQGNAEWDMSLTSVQSKIDECSGFSYSFAVIGFTLTRNYQFYIYFLIVPTFIITATCISGVMLPSTMSTGEKMSTGVAGLLGLTFLLSIIVQEVPRAPKLPLLGKWVIGEMSFCVIAIAVNAIGLYFDKFSERNKYLRKRHGIVIWVKFLSYIIVFFGNLLFTVIVLAAREQRLPPSHYDTM